MNNYLRFTIVVLTTFLIALNSFGQESISYFYKIDSQDYPEINIRGRFLNYVDSLQIYAQKEKVLNITYNGVTCDSVHLVPEIPFDTIFLHIFPLSNKIDEDAIFEVVDIIKEIQTISNSYLITRFYFPVDGKLIPMPVDSAHLSAKIVEKNTSGLLDSLFFNLNNNKINFLFPIMYKYDRALAKMINARVLKEKNPENYLIGTFSEKIKSKDGFPGTNLILNDTNCILFNLKFNNKYHKKEILPYFQEFLNSYFHLSFYPQFDYQLNYSMEYIISTTLSKKVQVDKVDIHFPKKEVDDFFTFKYLELANILSADYKYKEALDTLDYAISQLYSSSILQTVADSLIIRYGEKETLERKDPRDLLKYLEDKKSLKVNEKEWYVEFKLNMLNQYFDQLEEDQVDVEKLYEINSFRLFYAPDNSEFILLDLYYKAVTAENNKEYIKSVDYFDSYLKLKSNPENYNRLLSNLNTGLEEYFKNGNYEELYQAGKQFNKYLSNSFKLRYYYIMASLDIFDYNTALINLSWLLDNWHDNQDFITWDEAFNLLEQLYTRNFSFDKAMELDQRFFRITDDATLLSNYYMNFRIKYLKPIVEGIKTHLENINFGNTNLQNDYSTIFIPEYINGIYLLNFNDRNKILIENSQITPPARSVISNIKEYPAILTNNSDKVYWILNKYNDIIIVAEINDSVKNEQNIILEEIRTKKMMVEPWQKLQDNEKIRLIKFLSQFICQLFSAEISLNNTVDLNNYWINLKSNDYIHYLAIYEENGVLLNSNGITISEPGENKILWEKSLVSRTYFLQEIKTNGLVFYDLTNPLFVNNYRKGIAKIGIIK
ncbi:MAG: hypothetical protein KQI35_14330 [Bacteroidetes bacterium]|nr:hypothetical protein [Bacteroidota bacterium]